MTEASIEWPKWVRKLLAVRSMSKESAALFNWKLEKCLNNELSTSESQETISLCIFIAEFPETFTFENSITLPVKVLNFKEIKPKPKNLSASASKTPLRTKTALDHLIAPNSKSEALESLKRFLLQSNIKAIFKKKLRNHCILS
tara:strand:+ start:573 stop:1004 length:432 start_codon:yes stop_codon:yes gene_type:complete